mgnify:CR=1 FL=1
MKKLSEVNFEGKRVLVRCDFNVPIEDGCIVEDERIRSACQTIKKILDDQPKNILLISHLGKPKGERLDDFSLKPVAKRLSEILGQEVCLFEDLDSIEALKVENNCYTEKVFLLENIRFWKEEESADESFAKKVAEGFDVYVGEAFSASHRAHASISLMPKYTKERCMGLLFEEELTELSKILKPQERPAVAIIGGAKIETKLPVIEKLKERYDFILLGGKIANEALDQKMELGENVLLPIDFSPAEEEDLRLDIGPKTVEKYLEIIASAKSIVWNGPLGMFERKEYALGTEKILMGIVSNLTAYQLVGGGETIEAVKKFGSLADFDYVSMSGGAMLEFLEGKKLPGIEALQ